MANERGFAMGAAVRLREDYEAAQLRVLAKRSENAAQTRRLLALSAIYDGGSRSEAAKIGGVGLQTVRDWMLAFNAEGPAGLVDRKAPGNRPILTDAQRHDLMRIVESGPTPAVLSFRLTSGWETWRCSTSPLIASCAAAMSSRSRSRNGS